MPTALQRLAISHTARNAGPVHISEGSSAYFTDPETVLDPSLFDKEEKLHPQVRRLLQDMLFRFWEPLLFGKRDWVTLWLAGSGASYQWDADRSTGTGTPGDLDILIGIEWQEFYRNNPDYRGLSTSEITCLINDELRIGLWPMTANVVIGDERFEVTYYVNENSGQPGIGIAAIHPYAAYDITHDTWTIRPKRQAGQPGQYGNAIDAEHAHAERIVIGYNTLREQMDRWPADSPQWINLADSLARVVADGETLWQDIHTTRSNAFSPQGEGFGDFYNYRWQAHKASGVTRALRTIAGIAVTARTHANFESYGSDLPSSDVLTIRAIRGRNS